MMSHKNLFNVNNALNSKIPNKKLLLKKNTGRQMYSIQLILSEPSMPQLEEERHGNKARQAVTGMGTGGMEVGVVGSGSRGSWASYFAQRATSTMGDRR